MKASLAYIEDVMDRAIAQEGAKPTVSDVDRAKATSDAKKLVGGFRVHDHAAERKSIDDLIAKRRTSIEQFRVDRAAVRDRLGTLGITPLAVCPSGAWYKVLRDAGLFVLNPDNYNRVQISRKPFEAFTGKSAESNLASFMKAKWPEFLKQAMPDGLSLASGGMTATLILPDPPADVADTLCKAQSLKLTVAAVAEAISFAEKPADLLKAATANPKDVWAREQGYDDYQDWLKRDPIIFTEHGTASAVIAQFGEFPIEKEVVEAVVSSDGLLSEKPKAAEIVTTLRFGQSVSDMYNQYINELLRQDGQNAMQAQMQAQRLVSHARSGQASDLYNSSDWTGR